MSHSRILDATNFVPESSWTPTHWYANADLYSAMDAMGVELEVAELLYGFVRALKPGAVFESGSYPGVSTDAISLALKDNHHGLLYAWEPDPSYRVEVGMKLLARPVLILESPPTDYGAFRLCFIDSPYDDRLEELNTWHRTAQPGSVVIVHDTKVEWDHGYLKRWNATVLDTPRGVGILQR